MLMNDYGISDYNIIIFTTEENVTERPEVVERFLLEHPADDLPHHGRGAVGGSG